MIDVVELLNYLVFRNDFGCLIPLAEVDLTPHVVGYLWFSWGDAEWGGMSISFFKLTTKSYFFFLKGRK